MTRLLMLFTCVALMIGATLTAQDAPAATTLSGTSGDFVRPSADVVPMGMVVQQPAEPSVPAAPTSRLKLVASKVTYVIGGTTLANGSVLESDAVFDIVARTLRRW